tara:strand:- start:300 stop:458 length:159 start_codon:yes stop_codon:yes gene_type:complete
LIIKVSRLANVPADKRELFEGKCNRLSMQVNIDINIDIWLKQLVAEIAHILG